MFVRKIDLHAFDEKGIRAAKAKTPGGAER
jgi:hypothetical protein